MQRLHVRWLRRHRTWLNPPPRAFRNERVGGGVASQTPHVAESMISHLIQSSGKVVDNIVDMLRTDAQTHGRGGYVLTFKFFGREL